MTHRVALGGFLALIGTPFAIGREIVRPIKSKIRQYGTGFLNIFMKLPILGTDSFYLVSGFDKLRLFADFPCVVIGADDVIN